MMKKHSAQLTLTVVSFLLGLLLVIQFRTQGKLAGSVYAQSSTDQALIIGGLVDGNSALRREISSLDSDLSSYQRTAGQGNLEGMVAELNRLKVMNGMVEVSGPGVEVLISGGVTALDLQDLVNEARNAGAEALSLNGYRLVARSVVVASNGTVRLEENRLSPPYRLQAIGHPETLEKALNRKGGLLALLQYSYPSATITVTKRDNMVLPLYLGTYVFRYARAVP